MRRRRRAAGTDKLPDVLSYINEGVVELQDNATDLEALIRTTSEFMGDVEGQLSGREMLQLKDALYHLRTTLPLANRQLREAVSKIQEILGE